MDRRSTLAAAAALAALLAGGCDPQVEAATYAGEALFTVDGTVATAASTPLPPVEAALLWQRNAPPLETDQEFAFRAPVEAASAATYASFRVSVHLPPPAAAVRTLLADEPGFARATIAVVPYGVSADAAPALPTAGSPSYGVSAGHWIIHLASDVPAGSLTAWWLGGALPAGFHLVRITPLPCPTADELASCVATLKGYGLPEGTAADLTTAQTAHAFCLARYRLTPAPASDRAYVLLGPSGPTGPSGPPGTCP